MNEFELIARLTSAAPKHERLLVGPGDDCAVLDWGTPDRLLLFKTDAVVEGVHFTAEAAPESIGHKALARPLSDLAAMAGRPEAALITIGLPRSFSAERVEKIYAGLYALARKYQVGIAGGETTASPDRLWISVAVIGAVATGRLVRRAGAQVNDAIFVTGELGGSIAGKHLAFEPRLAEAAWLSEHFPVHCMIDVSDGLAGDLRHLLDASGLGAELRAAAIPISRAARAAARSASGKPPLLAALTDGEDFELLFTVPAQAAVPLLDKWKQRFPEVRLSCVGKIRAEAGAILRDETGVRTLPEHGYVHFQSP